MKLDKWLEKSPHTQETFGREIGRVLGRKAGLTQGRVSQIIRKGARDYYVVKAIEELTGGAVSAEDLRVGGAE
jgi:hypothetical protein